jgi:hypothetical protein
MHMSGIYARCVRGHPKNRLLCRHTLVLAVSTMAHCLRSVCVLVCLLHTVAIAPNAPAALMHSRHRASAVPVHAGPFTDSIAASTGRAFKQTFQPATVLSLMTTQAVLLLFVLTKSASGAEVHIADLFSFKKVFLRLSVGLCSAFFNKMLNMGQNRCLCGCAGRACSLRGLREQ